MEIIPSIHIILIWNEGVQEKNLSNIRTVCRFTIGFKSKEYNFDHILSSIQKTK